MDFLRGIAGFVLIVLGLAALFAAGVCFFIRHYWRWRNVRRDIKAHHHSRFLMFGSKDGDTGEMKEQNR